LKKLGLKTQPDLVGWQLAARNRAVERLISWQRRNQQWWMKGRIGKKREEEI
jgi:hypothetical protein